MKKAFGSLLVVLCVGFGLNSEAHLLTEEEKQSDLMQLKSLIQSGYGPLEYKRSRGIELDELTHRYMELSKSTKTNADFYYLLVKMVAEFQDSHFGSRLPTDYETYLPFHTDYVQGKVLIEEIDREELSEEDFPFEKGDEIVEFADKPVGEILDQLQLYVSMGYAPSARRIAAMAISRRRANRMPTESGVVSMKIRKGTSQVIKTVELEWQEKGEQSPALLSEEGSGEGPTEEDHWASDINDYDRLSVQNLWGDYLGESVGRKYFCSGKTRIEKPEEATVIMEEPFVAYYHSTPKGNVGYLRIPHYSPQNQETQEPEYDLRFAQYEYAISELEKNTVGLVIDQDHNCGGSVAYLERMLGLFMADEYSSIQFQLLASHQEYLAFKKWLDEGNKHTLGYQGRKRTLELIKKHWLDGDFMTPMTSIFGIEKRKPHGGVRYTHPIIVLIDEMSGSGGDAFPAMMQGLGRAQLLGTRTMGAGGHVEAQPPLNFSRVGFRMTKSLFFRPDGVAVENNGAVPDIEYQITRNDFLYDFVEYREFYLSKLLELISE